MPSIWEILEFIRVLGGETVTAQLRRKFGPSYSKPLIRLKLWGYVELIPVKKNPNASRPRTYIVRLTENAYKLLEKYGVESFYDLPFVKAREMWFMEMFGRRFARFDQI